MFCRGCGYDLRTLGARKCPECGRTFDPANGRTFFAKKQRLGLRRWARWVVVMMAVLAGGLLIWRECMQGAWVQILAASANPGETIQFSVPSYWPVVVWTPVVTAVLLLVAARGRRLGIMAIFCAMIACTHGALWWWISGHYVLVQRIEERELSEYALKNVRIFETQVTALDANSEGIHFHQGLDRRAIGYGLQDETDIPSQGLRFEFTMSSARSRDHLVTYYPGMPMDGFWFRHGFQWGGWTSRQPRARLYLYSQVFTIAFPQWAVTAICSVVPCVWASRCILLRLRRFRRRNAGLCIVCGYDLRGQEGICPECGTGVCRSNPAQKKQITDQIRIT